MLIVETCPRCGAPLLDSVVATFPPIPQKDCPSCGWHWEGEPEPVQYAPLSVGGCWPQEGTPPTDWDVLRNNPF